MTLEEELKVKKVPGRYRVLKISTYRGIKIYIRLTGTDMFEYMLPYGGEIYSSYLIITPTKGKTKLTKQQIARSAAMILAGGTTTIDYLLDPKHLAGVKNGMAETFEKNRSKLKDKNGSSKTS